MTDDGNTEVSVSGVFISVTGPGIGESTKDFDGDCRCGADSNLDRRRNADG